MEITKPLIALGNVAYSVRETANSIQKCKVVAYEVMNNKLFYKIVYLLPPDDHEFGGGFVELIELEESLETAENRINDHYATGVEP